MRDVAAVVEDGYRMELATGEVVELSIDGHVVASSRTTGLAQPLAEMALSPLAGRDDISVLLAGLGMGQTLRALLDRPGVTRVDVVEVSQAVLDWDTAAFRALNGEATADPRVHLHRGELSAFLAATRIPDEPADGWFALVLDIDEYPSWVARPGNRSLYSERLDLLESGLRPGGVLAIWTSERDDALQKRMHGRLQQVNRVTIPVDDSLRYVYRGRRAPRRAS